MVAACAGFARPMQRMRDCASSQPSSPAIVLSLTTGHRIQTASGLRLAVKDNIDMKGVDYDCRFGDLFPNPQTRDEGCGVSGDRAPA